MRAHRMIWRIVSVIFFFSPRMYFAPAAVIRLSLQMRMSFLILGSGAYLANNDFLPRH